MSHFQWLQSSLQCWINLFCWTTWLFQQELCVEFKYKFRRINIVKIQYIFGILENSHIIHNCSSVQNNNNKDTVVRFFKFLRTSSYFIKEILYFDSWLKYGNSEHSSFFSLGPYENNVVQYEIHVLYDFIVIVTDAVSWFPQNNIYAGQKWICVKNGSTHTNAITIFIKPILLISKNTRPNRHYIFSI